VKLNLSDRFFAWRDRSTSCDRAGGGVSRWTLAKGKVVAATGEDMARAVKETSPAVIVALQVDKSSDTNLPLASLSTRGLDSAGLLEQTPDARSLAACQHPRTFKTSDAKIYGYG